VELDEHVPTALHGSRRALRLPHLPVVAVEEVLPGLSVLLALPEGVGEVLVQPGAGRRPQLAPGDT
jgi:hypothetical protein